MVYLHVHEKTYQFANIADLFLAAFIVEFDAYNGENTELRSIVSYIDTGKKDEYLQNNSFVIMSESEYSQLNPDLSLELALLRRLYIIINQSKMIGDDFTILIFNISDNHADVKSFCNSQKPQLNDRECIVKQIILPLQMMTITRRTDPDLRNFINDRQNSAQQQQAPSSSSSLRMGFN